MAKQTRRQDASPLIVGDPTARSDEARSNLPGAVAEAQAVARLYRTATLLTHEKANRANVLAGLRSTSIFHFAGHALFNNEQPELSYLALAPTASNDGILLAREIGSLRLSNLEIVVLSACSTSSPRATRSGAISGLANSFFRAGAPATVSTLWDVDDAAAREVLTQFHRAYVGGASAAAALQAAQLAALDRPELRAPHAWAAFVYAGP
jgi:CHAT domain-containing protein